MHGKWRRFTIGKYKVLEKIGSGGMGNVFLCEHKLMRRRVAIKVLPTAKAADEASRERFYREARVVAALDHPNIVHAYDIDQDDNLAFHCDGVCRRLEPARHREKDRAHGRDPSLPLHSPGDPGSGPCPRAGEYRAPRHQARQHLGGSRSGVVKILDMGLARFFDDEEDMLTKKFDGNNMGTLDYQAPEQALDSHAVDIRADIYGLGATFYYLLTGSTLFEEGSLAQKVDVAPNAPAEAGLGIPQGHSPGYSRYFRPHVGERARSSALQIPPSWPSCLDPFTQTPIEPPLESEMPQLSAAATGVGGQNSGSASTISGPRSGRSGSGAPKAAPAPRSGHAAAVMTPSPKASATPAPHRPAGRPVVFAKMEVEKDPWNKLTHDTPDHTLQSNTPLETVRPSGLIEREELVRRQGNTPPLDAGHRAGRYALGLGRHAAHEIRVQPTGRCGLASAALTVSKDGSKGFKSISQALRSAKPGDVIEIYDAVHEENLLVDAHGADVTLQAAPGMEVRWLADQKKKDDHAPLIHISKAPGFHIKGKGITLDGTLDNNRRRAISCSSLRFHPD